MLCQVLITQEENWYVATDINSNVASQGKNINEAMENLKEALELFYEDAEISNINEKPAFLTTMEVYA